MERQSSKYDLIKEKLDSFETDPDPHAWEKINFALHKKPLYLKLNKWNNYSIAVSLLSIFVFSIFLSPRLMNPLTKEAEKLEVSDKDTSGLPYPKNIPTHQLKAKPSQHIIP